MALSRALLACLAAGHAAPSCSPGSEGQCEASWGKEHPWPWNGRDTNQSGLALHAGAFDLSKPSWVFRHPARPGFGADSLNMMQTPLIDRDGNIFAGSVSGAVYAFDRRGSRLWSKEDLFHCAGGMALVGEALYTLTVNGFAFKVDRRSGREVWRRKVANSGPCDSHSLVAAGEETVIAACSLVDELPVKPHPHAGSDGICALRTADGSLRWRFSFAGTSTAITYNLASCILGDAVLLSDLAGGVYSVALADGTLRWYSPGPVAASWTTGGISVGPGGMVYSTANAGHPSGREQGFLRALEAATGKVAWTQRFHEPLNAKPAVGPVCCDGAGGLQPALVLAVGSNPSCDPLSWADWAKKLQGKLPFHKGLVTALRPDGTTLWRFWPPLHAGPVTGISEQEPCCPDMWGPPTIGGDGTVYANWAGGRSFALRDADGNGEIDAADPREFSSYAHGHGSQSGTAIAEGLIAMTACRKLLVFSSGQ